MSLCLVTFRTQLDSVETWYVPYWERSLSIGAGITFDDGRRAESDWRESVWLRQVYLVILKDGRLLHFGGGQLGLGRDPKGGFHDEDGSPRMTQVMWPEVDSIEARLLVECAPDLADVDPVILARGLAKIVDDCAQGSGETPNEYSPIYRPPMHRPIHTEPSRKGFWRRR